MTQINPFLAQTSWIPNRTGDYMAGESRLDGQVIQIHGWHARSHASKLKALRELAVNYGGDPHMRWFVVNNILRPAGVQQRDYARQAAAILSYVQTHVYYTNEPDEQVQTPWRTLKVGTGDCDDSSLLLATFAESIRLPWRFVIGGTLKGKPYRWIENTKGPARGAHFGHIYVILGWPPFSPKTWAIAESTARVPLGTDILMQGQGEAALGIPGGNGGTRFVQSMGMGMGTPYSKTSYSKTSYGKMPQIEGLTIPWGQLLVGIIEGTLTGVAVAVTLRLLKVE